MSTNELNHIYSRPVTRIERDDTRYPKNAYSIMGRKAPKHLDMVGNLNLLSSIAIGFSGSRNSSKEGVCFTRDIATQVSDADITIVSGNATGIDISAHRTALESSGTTIFVLPEGIGNFRIRDSLEDVWDWDRVLVISQFDFSDDWEVYRAMHRNLLILSLVRAMIVIEAGSTGGSLYCGEQSINSGLPLFVVDDLPTAEGNKSLLRMGAEPLARSTQTQKVCLNGLFDATKNEYTPRQKRLL